MKALTMKMSTQGKTGVTVVSTMREPVAYKERIWTMPVAKKRHPIMILALRTVQIL